MIPLVASTSPTRAFPPRRRAPALRRSRVLLGVVRDPDTIIAALRRVLAVRTSRRYLDERMKVFSRRAARPPANSSTRSRAPCAFAAMAVRALRPTRCTTRLANAGPPQAAPWLYSRWRAIPPPRIRQRVSGTPRARRPETLTRSTPPSNSGSAPMDVIAAPRRRRAACRRRGRRGGDGGPDRPARRPSRAVGRRRAVPICVDSSMGERRRAEVVDDRHHQPRHREVGRRWDACTSTRFVTRRSRPSDETRRTRGVAASSTGCVVEDGTGALPPSSAK